MSIQTETNRVQYQGNGSTSIEYPVPFYFLEKNDIRVVVTDSAGTDIALTLTTDYTVMGEGNATGGGILTTTAWNSSYKVTIFREVSATQTTVYEENADFPAKSEERALDKLTMLVQQVTRKLKQSFRLRESDGETQETPKVVNSVFGLGANGHPVFRTAAEVASWLNLTQDFFDAPTKTFANAAERALAVPGFPGQLASQRDNGSIWIANGVSGGNWVVFAPGANSVVLSMLANQILANSTEGRSKMADGFLSADTNGRAKMADGFLSLPKLSAGLFTADAEGRGKFANGFVDPNLTQAGLWNAIAPAGAVLQTVSTTYDVNADITTVIPPDNSKPQYFEGTQILALSITPYFSTSKIRATFLGYASGNDVGIGAALFRDGSTNPNAIAAAQTIIMNSAHGVGPAAIDYIDSPATTSAIQYSVRVGPSQASTIRFNGIYSGTWNYGGAMRSTLILEEIKS